MIDVRCNARTASGAGSTRSEQRCQLYAGHGSLHAALTHGDESAAGAARMVITWRSGQPAGQPAEVHDGSHAAGFAWAPGFPAFEGPVSPEAKARIPAAHEAAAPAASDQHTADVIALRPPKRRSKTKSQATSTQAPAMETPSLLEAITDESDIAEVADGSGAIAPASGSGAASQVPDRPGRRPSQLSSA